MPQKTIPHHTYGKSFAGAEKFILGNACMLLATIFWGVNIPVAKALIPAWMSPEGVAATRLIGGALLFWLTSIFVKCEKIEHDDRLKLAAGGFIGLFAFIYLFMISLRYGSAIDVSIIMSLPPVFVLLIGVIFKGERPHPLEYCGVVISFIGAALVIFYGASAHAQGRLAGNLLAALSAFCYALYLVILEKPSRKYRPLSLLRWVYLFSAIPALFLLPGLEKMPILSSDSAVPWLEIGFILLCPTYLAYFLIQPAIKNIGSELTSLYQYLIPVVAAIAAALMGLEHIVMIQILAMALIIGGMVLTNIGKKKRAAKTGPGHQDKTAPKEAEA